MSVKAERQASELQQVPVAKLAPYAHNACTHRARLRLPGSAAGNLPDRVQIVFTSTVEERGDHPHQNADEVRSRAHVITLPSGTDKL